MATGPAYNTKEDLEAAIERALALDHPENSYARVYFVREEGSGAIKIGTSVRVRDRFNMIKSDNPNEVVLLAQIHGGRRVESILHTQFEYARIRGEWFRPVDPLVTFVSELPDTEQRDLDALFAKRRATRIIT